MTAEQLQEKLGFITDNLIKKTILMFVTTGSTSLQLFNIVNDDLGELLELFAKSIKESILDKKELVVENYSTSIRREGVIHEYDLHGNLTDEMNRMIEVENIDNPIYFDKKKTKIELINGIYIVIKSNDNKNSVTLYKTITNVDKAYASASFFLFGHQDSTFMRQRETMLKVSSSFQMIQLEGTILLVDLDKLEKPLHLDAVLEKETSRDVVKISDNFVINNEHLLKACQKPIVCKKLRHALKDGMVIKKLNAGLLTGKKIIEFVRTKTALSFHYNKEYTQIDLKNEAEAIRFIKLMDDDYVMSELTLEKYDSRDKDRIEGKNKA